MADLWTKPIELTIDSSDHFTSVRNSRDALACLLNSWPKKGGPAFAEAKRACLQSIDGTGDTALAETAFIRAAEEAGILRVR